MSLVRSSGDEVLGLDSGNQTGGRQGTEALRGGRHWCIVTSMIHGLKDVFPVVFVPLIVMIVLIPLGSIAESTERLKPLPLWAQPVVLFLDSLEKPDGGYGWPDQPFGHVSATWAVTGAYKIIGREPPGRNRLVDFIRTNHPFDGSTPRSIAHAAELKTLVYQQVQSLQWLGESGDGFRNRVSEWELPSKYPKFYELEGYPVFQEEVMALLCRELLELDPESVSVGMWNQVAKRLRPNGSYNNTAGAEGSGGHVLNTLWGLLANRYFGGKPNHIEALTTWLRDCQNDDGGFAESPPFASSRSDLFFSWAAVRALEVCESQPRDISRCVRFVLRHWQDDGGFSYHEAGESDPMATYYALDTLRRLGALDSLENHLRQPRREPREFPPNLRVFSVQLNAPGQGSPTELIRLARSLKIQHWLTRNGIDGYRETLQRLATAQKVSVVFDKAQEDYNLHLEIPGVGSYARTSLLLTPNRVPELDRETVRSMLWADYRPMRVRLLNKRDGLMVWNVCDNEVYARSALDDSLGTGGYDLINVFHFGGWDLLVNFPWLRNYSGRIPYVALSNTQGGQAWWWADRLASFRTLYLAEEASWSGWRAAVDKNWVVAVRLNEKLGEPVIYGGTPEVRQFTIDKMDEWRWWRNGGAIYRPAVSLVAVRPGDPFELPSPETGVMLRARTWWWTDASGYPTKKRSELVSMTLDGEAVHPQLVEVPNFEDRIVDCYYRFDLPKIAPGRHVATAEVRVVDSGARHSQSIEFVIP